ncbi:MAG TPA: NAD(P)H-dependent oxidoreductase [Gemmatimonadaceae bacterium]|jgi:chromate reductase|nr:NAD(P)H-dependent oxidoreductase [Gemmatimonadaceae bacterium]
MTPASNAPWRVLALVGSLRAKSLNRALYQAATELAPPTLSLTLFDRLREIPPFDDDATSEPPAVIADLKAALAGADAVLIVTPEYNYSVPGALKNAIDWVSRPPATTPLRGKPAMLMGVSTGMSGTMRAQLHWRQVFVFTQTPVMLQPEVQIPRAAERFNEVPELTDASTRDLVQRSLVAFAEWIPRFVAPRA